MPKKKQKSYPKIHQELLVGLLVVFVALFSWAVSEVFYNRSFLPADDLLAEFFATRQSIFLTGIFFIFTLLGQPIVVIISTAAACVFLKKRKREWYIISLLTSVLGSVFTAIILKEIFARTRPEAAIFELTTYAFPSAHATIAVSLFGFLMYIFLREIRAGKKEVIGVVLVALVIALIGLSRMYLGVHFLSDIIAGYCVGLFWLIVGILLSEWARKESR